MSHTPSPGVQESTAKHSVSVAGVVVNRENQFLVVQRRDNGKWEPPGGVLELDESFEQGVCREVLEETGVHINVESLTGVYKNMVQSVVALVFRCSVASGEPQEREEARQVRWVDEAEAAELMDEAYFARVRDALSGGPVSVRAHDGVNLF